MKSIWSGLLSFGLVNIPINLFSASRERALTFHLFDKKDHCPISFKKVCRNDDHPVEQKDIVKGYELEKGQFVILEKDDFKKANARKTSTIDIMSFTDVSGIDERYYEKPYFIIPEEKAAKAYVLLRDAVGHEKKAAVARFVMREKEHIAIIRPHENLLILMQLRFNDELVSPEEFKIPESAKYSKKELDMAVNLVKHMDEEFDPTKFKDTYTDELMKIIKAKAKGHKIKPQGTAPEATPSDMGTVLRLLEESLKKSA